MIETKTPSRLETAAGWTLLAIALGAFLAAVYVLTPPGMVGFTRDDSIYALGTRALLAGQGYVDLCFPEHPGVLRFPPGFSLMLLPFMAGGGDVVAQLTRAQLVAPLSAVAFILLSYRYLRLRAGLAPVTAAAGAAWVGFHPATLMLSSRLMADVPFAALGMAGVMAFEAAGTASAAWAGVGVLVGFTILVRYAGVALLAAGAVVLVRRRAWRELALMAAGCAVVVLPWLAYRQYLGGSDYARAYGVLMPHDLPGFIKAASIVAASFFGNAAPGMLFGGWFQSLFPLALSPAALAVGLGISTLIIAGAAMGWARPREGADGLGEAYLLITFVVVLAYSFGFTWYADNFMQRAFIPVMPFAMVAALRALEGWRRTQAGLVFLGTTSHVHGALIVLVLLWIPPTVPKSYFQVFDAIKRLTPADTVLMTTENHMITLYTDRYCETIPNYSGGVGANPRTATPRELVAAMHRRHVRYLVGLPVYEWGEVHDRSIALVNQLIFQAPGLLREVWMGPLRKFALWEVDPRGLEALNR